MKTVYHNRAEENLIHPDMIGLTTDDFNEDCIWDTVDMKNISRPTLYKIWNSALPINRKLSVNKDNLPLLFVVRTNYRINFEVRNSDPRSYVINTAHKGIEPESKQPKPYINIYNFRWLPLYVRLSHNNHSLTFKLVKTEKTSYNTYVSTGTNLLINTAKIGFIYEPIQHVSLDKNHCWFTLYPHRADRPTLEIIRKLPNNRSLESS